MMPIGSFFHMGTLFSAAFLGAIVVFFIATAVLMWLWNMTLPQLFRLPRIEYWQAFRLLIIASLLFGGGVFLHF